MNMLDFLSYIDGDVQLKIRHYEFVEVDYKGTVGDFLESVTSGLYKDSCLVATTIENNCMIVSYVWSTSVDRY